jgi:hypothetical protein
VAGLGERRELFDDVWVFEERGPVPGVGREPVDEAFELRPRPGPPEVVQEVPAAVAQVGLDLPAVAVDQVD